MASSARGVRIVLVGAGSASFGVGTLADILTVGKDCLEGATVVLHDLDDRALRVVGAALERVRPAWLTVEATSEPRRALEGARFVIVSIENGNRAETWKQDYYVPLRHGSRQVYGENGGAGGAFHTWRQMGPLLSLARAMESSCPGALLLNYSNPLPRLGLALSKASRVSTVGLCHGIGAALKALERILGTGVSGLEYTSAGLNHFYWLVKVKAKEDFAMPALGSHPGRSVRAGEDLLPDIRSRGYEWAVSEELHFVAELLRLYGHLCYPSQSHPAEYVAWADAYCPSVKYDFNAMVHRAENLRSRLEAAGEGRDDADWWVHPSGERAVHIIREVLLDAGEHEDAVNVVNGSVIPNLPADCVVEVPARVDGRGVHPDPVGPLPSPIARLLSKEVIVQQAVVEAGLSGDYDAAVRALLLDETVPTPGIARAILDEMIELQGELLPPFRRR